MRQVKIHKLGLLWRGMILRFFCAKILLSEARAGETGVIEYQFDFMLSADRSKCSGMFFSPGLSVQTRGECRVLPM